MFEYRSVAQILQQFEERKDNNKILASRFSYTEIDRWDNKKILVTTNDNGEPEGCLCQHCFEKLDHLPFSYGTYVSPMCINCLRDIEWIENTNKKETKMKTRTSKNDPKKITVDWTKFEQMAVAGEAKLVALAESYNIYPNDMRVLIIEKYGADVQFKRGRNGGICINNKSPQTTAV
jgi:hypothetical protein